MCAKPRKRPSISLSCPLFVVSLHLHPQTTNGKASKKQRFFRWSKSEREMNSKATRHSCCTAFLRAARGAPPQILLIPTAHVTAPPSRCGQVTRVSLFSFSGRNRYLMYTVLACEGVQHQCLSVYSTEPKMCTFHRPRDLTNMSAVVSPY